MSESSSYKTWMLVTFIVVVCGLSWPIFKVSLAYSPPLIFAGLRNFLGGLLLVLVFFSKRNEIRWRKTWPIYCISSLFNIILYYGLQAYGLVIMPSGLFSIIVYLQPVLVGILAWWWLDEKMTSRKVVGLVIGFFGVAAVSVKEVSNHVALAGIIIALITAVSWSIGAIYVKKVSHQVDPIWLTSFQCMFGGIVILALGSFTESWGDIKLNLPFWLCLLYGVLLGISASWVVYFRLVRSGDASTIASYTFLVPLIAVISGTLLLHEAFTLPLLVGLVLIIGSIYLISRKPKTAIIQNQSSK
jgi:drug/metabolite transporter (DMT)-like permease